MIIWLAQVITHFFCKIEVHRGLWQNPTQYIVTPNHIGMWDGFVVLATLPFNRVKFVVASEYYYGRKYSWPLGYVVRWLFKHSGACVPATFRIAKETLMEGYSLVIFPEGKISKSGKLERFKKGAVYFHLLYEIPIVPVKITGTNTKGLFKYVSVTYDYPLKLMASVGVVNAKLRDRIKEL